MKQTVAFKIVRQQYFPPPESRPAAVEQVIYEQLYRSVGSSLYQTDDDRVVLTLSLDPRVPLLPRIDFVYPFEEGLNDFDNVELARLWRSFTADRSEDLICQRLRRPLYADELGWIQARFTRWLQGQPIPGC